MKTIKMRTVLVTIFTSIVAIACSSVSSKNQKMANFKVYGNCGMCKKTIEKALKIDAISKIDWDKNTKMMEVKFDSTLISENEIKRRIAGVGYDTEEERATEDVYNSLHECCQYKRPE
jgi:mercuric ion binding protein